MSGLSWLIKPGAHNLYIPRHVPLGVFFPQTLCAYMNILSVYLKTLWQLIKLLTKFGEFKETVKQGPSFRMGIQMELVISVVLKLHSYLLEHLRFLNEKYID